MAKIHFGKTLTGPRVSEHPAVQAWGSLFGKVPELEQVRRLSRKRKSFVCRLTGDGVPGGSVIAKLSSRSDAAIERAVYEHVLAQIAIPAIRYYGSWDDSESERTWLFLEDASGREFAPRKGSHRAVAGCWLGMLHDLTAGRVPPTPLPDRSTSYYSALLGSARRALKANLGNPHLTVSHLRVLDRFAYSLDLVHANWDHICAICRQFPATLVHCDLVAKNARIRDTGDRKWFLPFDWEFAGWGIPAADLAQLNDRDAGSSVSPDLETYQRYAGAFSNGSRAIRDLAAVGAIFRVLHMVDWLTWSLGTDKIGIAAGAMRSYSSELRDVLRRLDLARADTECDSKWPSKDRQ